MRPIDDDTLKERLNELCPPAPGASVLMADVFRTVNETPTARPRPMRREEITSGDWVLLVVRGRIEFNRVNRTGVWGVTFVDTGTEYLWEKYGELWTCYDVRPIVEAVEEAENG